MANQENSRGQVKEDEGARGRLLSHEQDVGELSAQNRGGTTARGAEESKRLEEDDREQAAAQQRATRQHERELAGTLDLDEECNPRSDTPGTGNTRADKAARDATNRPSETYVDKNDSGQNQRQND